MCLSFQTVHFGLRTCRSKSIPSPSQIQRFLRRKCFCTQIYKWSCLWIDRNKPGDLSRQGKEREVHLSIWELSFEVSEARSLNLKVPDAKVTVVIAFQKVRSGCVWLRGILAKHWIGLAWIFWFSAQTHHRNWAHWIYRTPNCPPISTSFSHRRK